jgi:hypothetical protein
LTMASTGRNAPLAPLIRPCALPLLLCAMGKYPRASVLIFEGVKVVNDPQNTLMLR